MPTPSHHVPTLRHPAPRPQRAREASEQTVLDLGRLLVGIVVVAIGVLFLLDAAGTINADRAIDNWWPLVLIAAGLVTLAERPPSLVRGWLLTCAGAVLLLFSTDVLGPDAWKYIWPVAIIVAGISIAWHWRGRAVPRGADESDVLRSTAVFSGAKVLSSSRHFRGAWLTAVFGGVTLDLRDAVPDPGGASVNATVVFGGADILVPDGWRVNVRCIPIFGGVEDKRGHSGPVPDDAPVLNVDAVALFGGVEIKHQG